MKKIIAILMALLLTIAVCACGEQTNSGGNGSTKNGMSNDYITIDGICVDDSYKDEDGSPIRLVYLFYTLTAKDENLEIDSKYTKMTINEANTYESECSYDRMAFAASYYDSSYIEDVYTGTSIKVVATFKVPEGDLESGKSVTLSDDQIPQLEDIHFKTDDIQHFGSSEEIAKAIDPEGYAMEKEKREPADESTINAAREEMVGYYWSFYVNNISYQVEFTSNTTYEIRTGFGTSSTGAYEILKGYIRLVNDNTQAVNYVPYEYKDGNFDFEFTDAFDVKS